MMMRYAKWLAVMSVAVMGVGTVVAQTPVERLMRVGKISFRLNDSQYWIRVGVQCTIPAFQGGIGDQAPFCTTLSDLNGDGYALDFQATVNQIVNTIQSNELVTFIGTPIGTDKVRWTANRTFSPPPTALSLRGASTSGSS